jgi:DUF2914 family protein
MVMLMRPGSEAPPDKPDSDGKRGLDAEWNELLGTDAPADASAPDPGDSVSALADELDVGRSAEPDVPLDAPRVDEERTMATMMSGSWAMATRDASPSAGSRSQSSSTRGLRESDAEMAAIMGADLDAALERHSAAVPDPAAAKLAPVVAPPSPSAVTVMPSARSEPHEPRSLEDHRPRVAVASQPRRMVASDSRRITARSPSLDLGEPRGRLSLGWAAVAGVAIAGAIWWFQRPPQRESATRDDRARVASHTEPKAAALDASKRAPRTDERAAIPAATDLTAREPAAKPNAAEGEPAPPVVPEPTPTPRVEAPAVSPDAPAAPPKSPPTPAKPGTDPRTPPPGTPPEVAAVFVRLPVSPADLPPVGGVGATGLHVDRIEISASYDKTFCGGVAQRFSLAATSVVNVCLRAVHPRQEETVSIVWQKNDGSSARRGKIAIKPLHAYRTRAYLVLRKEYVGDWTVRIQSADGVELASHAFTITP